LSRPDLQVLFSEGLSPQPSTNTGPNRKGSSLFRNLRGDERFWEGNRRNDACLRESEKMELQQADTSCRWRRGDFRFRSWTDEMI